MADEIDWDSKSLGELGEFMAATANLIEMYSRDVRGQEERNLKERERLEEMTALYERMSAYALTRVRSPLPLDSDTQSGTKER